MPGPIPAEILDVLDGDTIAVRATIWLGQAVETHVRLSGIDAPELRAHCAEEKEKAEAARDLARRYQLTPQWQDRLTPEARRLVEAVLVHDRAAVTCLSCGAEFGQPHLPGCEFQS